jgi:5-methylcytosine-specific restriction endonuclease McrA
VNPALATLSQDASLTAANGASAFASGMLDKANSSGLVAAVMLAATDGEIGPGFGTALVGAGADVPVPEAPDLTSQAPVMTAGNGTSDGDRAGKAFTPKGREIVIDANKVENGGVTTCEYCGTQTIPGTRSAQGVSPPSNETNVDHIIPKSKGGNGDPSNGQVLCRGCNLDKSDTMP